MFILLIWPSTCALADGGLQFLKYIPELKVSGNFLQQGDVLFLNAPGDSGTNQRLVMVSLATMEATILSDVNDNFRILAANATHVAYGPKKPKSSVFVVDVVNRSVKTICCVDRAWRGYFVGNELRVIGDDGGFTTVTHVDPIEGKALRQTKLPNAPLTVPWQDKLVVPYHKPSKSSASNTLAVYDANLELHAQALLPGSQARGNLGCQASEPTMAPPRLVFVTSCGRINIFNLESMTLERSLPYISPAPFYSIAVTGDLLFALPHAKGEPTSIFRLSDGMHLAKIAIKANRIAAFGSRLAAVESDGRIALYEIDVARLADSATARDTALANCGSAKQMPAGTPPEAILARIESAPVAPFLADLEGLDEDGVDCATFYGRQLARTIDRIEDGIALLERIRASRPAHPAIDRAIEAAKERFALQTTGEENDVPAARSALEMTIGTGARGLGPEILLGESWIYAWQWGDLGGAHTVCTSLSVYSRKDFHLETVIPIAECDDEFQDSVSNVVEGPTGIFVAIQYRFKQEGRTDLVHVHKDSPSLVHRYHLMGSISRLYAREEGIVACSTMGECRLFDWGDFELPSKQVTVWVCQPRRSYSAPMQRPDSEERGRIAHPLIACGDEIVAAVVGDREEASVEFYDVRSPQAPLATVRAGWPDVAIDETRHRAIVESYSIETVNFSTIDLSSKAVRPELSLRHDKEGQLPWAVYGDILLVGRGRDLVIHNLAEGRTIAYLKDLVSLNREHASRGNVHRIEHLIVDEAFSRLIVLTRDGHLSRIISLPDLLADLAVHPPEWSVLDAELANESRGK